MTAEQGIRDCIVPSPTALKKAEVLANGEVAADLWRMRLQMSGWDSGEPSPGQFVMMRVSDDDDPLLARPFGISGLWLNHGSAELELIYRVVGRGTRSMTRWRPGSMARLLGPLGRGFPLPQQGSRSLLVAGGVGLPPLLALARKLEALGNAQDVVLLYGEASRDRLLDLGAVEGLGVPFQTCTEDGSCGTAGMVTDLLGEMGDGEGVHVYACGPAAMMRTVYGKVRDRCLSSFYSLESHMACGFGVCTGCAVEVKEGEGVNYVRVCTEGPVFPGEVLSERSFGEN